MFVCFLINLDNSITVSWLLWTLLVRVQVGAGETRNQDATWCTCCWLQQARWGWSTGFMDYNSNYSIWKQKLSGFYPPVEPERPKSQCEHHRDSVQTTSPEGLPILGAYVPQCHTDGQYKSQQVRPGCEGWPGMRMSYHWLLGFSAMGPLDTAGVWMLMARRGQGPEPHLGHKL